MTPIIWLLGLSGSGKTTLASLMRLYLESQNYDVALVDANHLATPATAAEQTRILREKALDLHSQGKICVVSAITPSRLLRHENRAEIPLYKEVWLRCGLATLVRRDPKGLYARARYGKAPHLPGISEPFAAATEADLIIDTDQLDLADCYVTLRDFVTEAIAEGMRWDTAYLGSGQMLAEARALISAPLF